MNTHDIEQHARFEDWFEQAIGRVKSMDGEDTIVAYHCRKAWQAAIEPYAKRIAELEHQLELIGAGGVDGRPLMNDMNNFELPPLPKPYAKARDRNRCDEHCTPIEANDDGWTDWQFPVQGYRMQCCDCGLVHIVDFSVEKIVERRADGSFITGSVQNPDYRVAFRMRRDDTLQPAEQVVKESLTGAETVKVPSDAQAYELWAAVVAQQPTLAETIPAFARALLDRYGQQSQPCELLGWRYRLTADAPWTITSARPKGLPESAEIQPIYACEKI